MSRREISHTDPMPQTNSMTLESRIRWNQRKRKCWGSSASGVWVEAVIEIIFWGGFVELQGTAAAGSRFQSLMVPSLREEQENKGEIRTLKEENG